MYDYIFQSSSCHGVDRTFSVDDCGGRVLDFEIDAPWHGSTEAGFGATLQATLSPEEVSGLATALIHWLRKNGHPAPGPEATP